MEISLIISVCLLVGSVGYAIWTRNVAMWLLPIYIIGNNALGFADDYFLSIEGVYNIKDIAFFGLFLFALIRLWSIKKFASNKVMVAFYFFMVFICIQLVISFAKYSNATATVAVFRKQIYYLGFLFSCIIFSSVTRREFYSFLKVFIGLLFIQSFMYVLKSITGINFFGVKDFQIITSGEVEIARNFRAFPNYMYLLIVFTMVYVQKTYAKYLLLLLIFLTIFFSYTRHWLLLGLYFAIAADFFRMPMLRHRLNVFIRFSFILIVVVVTFQALFGDSFGYFIKRIELMQKGGVDEGSLQTRIKMVSAGIDYVLRHDPFFGIGFIKRESFFHTSNVRNFGSEMGDSAWGNLVVQYGIIGNIFLWFFLFLLAREAYIYYRKMPEEKRWITLFIILAFTILPLHSIMTNVLQNPSPVSYLGWSLFFVERFDYWEKEKQHG